MWGGDYEERGRSVGTQKNLRKQEITRSRWGISLVNEEWDIWTIKII